MMSQAFHIWILGYSATFFAEFLKLDKVGWGSSVHIDLMDLPDVFIWVLGPLTGPPLGTHPGLLNTLEKTVIMNRIV